MNRTRFRLPVKRSSVLLLSSILLLGACAPGASTPVAAPPAATAATTPTVAATPPAEVVEVSTPQISCPPMDSPVRSRMDQLEEQVIRLRGLQPIRGVQRGLLTPSQLRDRVEDEFLADYTEEEARRDAQLLSMLGLIEPGLDLHSLYADLLSEQIAGFYDSQEGEMLIVCGAGFGGLEAFTYVHEYVHALQDHAYDLEQGLNFSDEACELDGERCFALRALIEGDASLLQEQWLRTFADEETFASLLSSLGEAESQVFGSAPAYIQAELTFPYLSGLAFVRSLYLEHDWAGVDAAFENPPISSEQIMHPERYPRDVPLVLEFPEASEEHESPWEIALRDVLGEWGTWQVLHTQLAEEAADQAAAGWGGDILLLFENKQNSNYALVLVTQWDTLRDAHEFAGSMFEYGEMRFGEPAHRDTVEATWVFDGGTSQFMRHSNQTRWIIAMDGELLSSLQSAVQLPLIVSQ